MEYDKTTASGAPESQAYVHDSQTGAPGSGRLRVKGDKVDISALAEPITFAFSGRTAKNRFLKGPMTERLCHWNAEGEDISARGVPSKELIHLYQRWGEGNIGIIVQGNTMVRYDAVEAYGNPILCDNHDGRLEQYRELVKATKAHGSLFICQISHPGRQGTNALNPNPVSASDVQLKIHWAGNEFNKPRALSIPEIEQMVQAWGETAYWCHEAGYDGVQIHCAHGYLLAQFLSGTTNHRTDAYGGSLANRSRIVLDIIAEVRRRVPDPAFIVCVKLNSVEFQAGGTSPEDCRALCVSLEAARVDFIDLSGGTFEGRAFEHKKESTRAREAYFIEFAELIAPLLSRTQLYITGGFRTGGAMVAALASGACAGVGIARPLAQDPYFCSRILGGEVDGAVENFVPLPQNTQASGTQLHQVAAGARAVSDWSDKGEVGRWVEAFEAETARKIALLPKVDSSGYPKLEIGVGVEYLRGQVTQ
ncbi:hypothetical protein MBLNU459_g3958t1 [Dothideomycetes sp. NU459]